jgi:archaeal chaperonin
MSENKNHSAQRMNIEAAKRIVGTVRTTLGPMGMDKMMVDGGGNVIVTNDGATILRELDSAHPAAKMIVEVSKMQESSCHDGTTSSVVLTGQLLANAEGLFDKGLHPNVINKGYTHAMNESRAFLESFSAPLNKDALTDIARTAITGKSLEASEEQVARLCVETINAVGDVNRVRMLAAPGGSLLDSYLFSGVVVNKDVVGGDDIDGTTTLPVLLLNGGLEEEKQATNMQVQVDAKSYNSVKNADRDRLLEAAKLVVDSGAKVVFVRDGVQDTIVSYLRKQGVLVCRRVPESTMKRLSSELGYPVHTIPEEDMGPIGAVIEKKTYNDVPYLFVCSNLASSEATLVLFGATQSTLDEVQRGFDDALGVVSLVANGDTTVYGGGVTYLAIAMHLRENASTIGGRAQMAIEAFADALESIPGTIAENAGHDALDTILAMRHAGGSMGPDVDNGGITCMKELGVREPKSLIRSAITSATEVATAILRIDDVIGRRGE